MVTGKKGFSLLEVIFALTLLAGVIFTLGILIPQALIYTRDTGIDMVAYREAEKLLENIRSMGTPGSTLATLDSGGQFFDGTSSGPLVCPPSPFPSETVQIQSHGVNTGYTFTFQVQLGALTPIGGNSTPNGYERSVAVTVLWNQALGGAQTMVRSTSNPSGGNKWTVTSLVFFQ